MRTLALLLAAPFLIGAIPAFAPPSSRVRMVYRHASLIDGTGKSLQPNMAVITSGDRIVAVLPDSALTQAQLGGATETDLKGKFLLPGFIDSHQHLATPPARSEAERRLRRDVYSGITATRDMADDLDWPRLLDEAIPDVMLRRYVVIDYAALARDGASAWDLVEGNDGRTYVFMR